jgi:hypothetical protein
MKCEEILISNNNKPFLLPVSLILTLKCVWFGSAQCFEEFREVLHIQPAVGQSHEYIAGRNHGASGVFAIIA